MQMNSKIIQFFIQILCHFHLTVGTNLIDPADPFWAYERVEQWPQRSPPGGGPQIPRLRATAHQTQHRSAARELQSQIRPPPVSKSGGPLSVTLGFYLESLGDFRETQMSFDVDLYMYMSWRDPSLQHPGPDDVMVNDDKLRKQLWLPDLYFANARQATFHHVTVPNFNLFIATDGTVAYSSRVTLTVACNLKLHDYPMDEQQCRVRVLSYAYIAKIVNVTWFRHQPIMYNPEIDLPEFDIERVGAEYCDGTYRYAVTERSYKTDRFSCLMANLYLRRRIGFNMVQSYIPTGLIVIISWVSFWIDRRAVPARVTLSFTTLLTMTTLGNGMRFVLPRVSYAKAIDYWFGACMLFIFLALVEFALVNSYMRRSEKYEKLSNKYKRKTSFDNILALSPLLSSELAHNYAQLQKMGRRKSSAMAMLKGRRKSAMVPAKEREDSTMSEDLSESREDTVTSNNVAGNDGQPKLGKCQSENADPWPVIVAMNGSYYDNMVWSMSGRKESTDHPQPPPIKNGGNGIKMMLQRSPKKHGVSVAFAVDAESKQNQNSADDREDETALLPPADPSEEEETTKVEPNPQLSVKYLEASRLLSRRALWIDKVSRILFPVSFVLFNCTYWGYYLFLRHGSRLFSF